MTLRQHFDESLEEVRSEVIRMGGVARDMVKMAVDAALNGEIELAAEVIRMDDEVDRLEEELVQKTVLVVMREQPVGADLRHLAATLGVIGEIEKVADDAVKLARRATKLSTSFPAEMKAALVAMGEVARTAFASSLMLYSEYDDAHAHEIIRSDKEVDMQYRSAREKVFALIKKNPDATEQLVRTIEIFHALEHVADHAVEIAARLQLHHGRQAHE
ncbi:MAG: phosphate signaling complex protein PhoU [Fimbriimonadaceae bacterium]